MGTRRNLVILVVLAVGLVWLGSWIGRQIFARSMVDNEHIIFAPDETYELTGAMDKPLVVVADEVVLENEIAGDSAFIGDTITVKGPVNGNITLMGDNVTVSGHVNGDASLIGERVVVDGRVDGNLTVVGDHLSIGQGAQIGGKVVACVDSLSDARPDGQIQPCSDAETLAALNTALQFDASLWGAGFSTLALVVTGFGSLVMTGISALAVAVFPRQISYIEEAILTMPRRVGRAGLLVFLLAVGVTVGVVVLLAVFPPLGLIALPVFGIAALVFLGMTVSGWITVALIVGNWLLRRVSRGLPPLITVAIGSVVLFLLWHVLALIPFGLLLVLLAMAVLGSLGLGAVVSTRLGTRPVRRRYFVQG